MTWIQRYPLNVRTSRVRIPGRGKCSLRTIVVDARVNLKLYLSKLGDQRFESRVDVNILIGIPNTHREIFSKYFQIKPKSDSFYHFPIDLIRFRKYFSVCAYLPRPPIQLTKTRLSGHKNHTFLPYIFSKNFSRFARS